MKKFWHRVLAYIVCSVFASALYGGWAFGAFTQYGFPGIYNATPFTLTSGQGSALSLDSQGRAILSPSSSLSSITATSGVFANLTFTNASGTTLTSTNIFATSKLGINSSSPAASLGVVGVSTDNPLLFSSSTGAQMVALKTNGQFVIGPNTLLNSAQMVVEHPTTNNVALNFTNGSDYTAQMGRVSAGLMYIGGPNGTSIALQAFGTNRLYVIGTNGLVGINSSSPIADLSIVNRTSSNTSTMSIGGTGVGKVCQWNGASWTITSYASNSITPVIATSTSCS